ncbi:hypothetical protein AvCA_08470 [Azotobacter vinelandii CA]|uniref:Uncharacterized protein n=2 Tax=Azotobacter vinelandii TaxID=354 RepID=C1DMR2_AZOVD|nr:hypothetical protein Avin_08470 [Azotobacter vinelandii DJ]AGK15492.1 hypothetical protein AvCA_08470 [Azotobacter vinelandii CA]AGK19557.1 hypothetical protein AvCA6_08470 [Azotobacter vinelandii CA6]
MGGPERGLSAPRGRTFPPRPHALHAWRGALGSRPPENTNLFRHPRSRPECPEAGVRPAFDRSTRIAASRPRAARARVADGPGHWISDSGRGTPLACFRARWESAVPVGPDFGLSSSEVCHGNDSR